MNIKKDKKIDRLVNINYTFSTHNFLKIERNFFILSLFVTLLIIFFNPISSILDLISRVIIGAISIFNIINLTFLFPTLILTGSIRSGNIQSLKEYNNPDKFYKFAIDYMEYLLINKKITYEEYERFFRRNLAIKNMREIYSPEKV